MSCHVNAFIHKYKKKINLISFCMLLTKPELVLHYEHSFMMKTKPVLSLEVLLLIEVRLVCRQKYIFLYT